MGDDMHIRLVYANPWNFLEQSRGLCLDCLGLCDEIQSLKLSYFCRRSTRKNALESYETNTKSVDIYAWIKHDSLKHNF